MKTVTLSAAYIPLVDAAPLIVAQEMGFAEAEGLSLDLIRAPSWSSVRDMLAFGRVDAAHLLSPVPVAMALGLGGVTTRLAAVSVLSVNGDVIAVSRALADRLAATGFAFDFCDATAAGEALRRVADKPLRIGAPFPFSMHVELLTYWLQAMGMPPEKMAIHTIPPPLMAQALAAGEVDVFCVGEPWGSIAVEQGTGVLLLPGNAIWAFAPEKVLAVREDWAETEPHLTDRLVRALWQAGRWLSRPDSHTAAAEILSRREYLDVAPEILDRALDGRLVISPRGEQRTVERFLVFHDGVATFPWRSQAAWIARQLAARGGLDGGAAARAGSAVFRSDLYRRAVKPLGADLPAASEKLEGAIRTPITQAAVEGALHLMPDLFFDGRIFDPAQP
ncbi:MAG: ABC transporter substrate-binding protein [Rhodobacteraceae bacterium]|nr:ABC transporter substrate-binding protein [Paracoccaceae bacterium]